LGASLTCATGARPARIGSSISVTLADRIAPSPEKHIDCYLLPPRDSNRRLGLLSAYGAEVRS
jgi:hypothetical protein